MSTFTKFSWKALVDEYAGAPEPVVAYEFGGGAVKKYEPVGGSSFYRESRIRPGTLVLADIEAENEDLIEVEQ
jgi:hypothetical protein